MVCIRPWQLLTARNLIKSNTFAFYQNIMYEVGKTWTENKKIGTKETTKNYLKLVLFKTAWEHTIQMFKKFGLVLLEQCVTIAIRIAIVSLLVCFVYLKESTCGTSKNVFYFTSKAFFILEIIKF